MMAGTNFCHQLRRMFHTDGERRLLWLQLVLSSMAIAEYITFSTKLMEVAGYQCIQLKSEIRMEEVFGASHSSQVY